MSELHDRGGWPVMNGDESEQEKRRKEKIRDKMKPLGHDKERGKAEEK